jgi:ribosomal protein L16 Arg81 hydroxylase
VRHRLANHCLLAPEAIVETAARLPPGFVELLVAPPGQEGVGRALDVAEVRRLVTRMSTASVSIMFRNMEQLLPYRRLMQALRDSLRQEAPWLLRDGERYMCFLFLSSPGVETPVHIDPEHNLLLQIQGSKTVIVEDRSRGSVVSNAQVRAFYRDEVGFRLRLKEDWRGVFDAHHLAPGDGLFIPHVAPHAVTNGLELSISLSFTFRSPTTEQHRARYL